MKAINVLAIATAGALLGGVAFIYSGAFPPGADQPHSTLVYRVLETTRDRAIAVRADAITVPSLDDPLLIRSGAGNYDAMCSGCHLLPGVKESELSKGLYPSPPALSEVDDLKPGEAFWIIKHGIKASGMPAWGKSMDDRYIWGLVAFVMKLPTLSEEQYKTEVACSGGHSHGGNVTVEHHHDHPEGDADAHDEVAQEHENGEEHFHGSGAEHHHGDAAIDCGHGSGDDETGTPAGHEHVEESGHDHAAMQNMDHSATDHSRMQGMDHSKMQDMDHSRMQDMGHSTMSGMRHGTADSLRSLPIKNAAEASVQAFQDALQVGNRKLALQQLDPDLRVDEGGHRENSRDEYASEHLQEDIEFLKTARSYPQSRNSNVNGVSATVDTKTRIIANAGGKTVDVLSSEVATLRKTHEGWRIVHLQWSSAPSRQVEPIRR